MPAPPARRRHPRAALPATALVFTRSRILGPCVVENLSRGGIRLVCDEVVRRGQKLTVLLDLPGHAGTSLPAEVRRHSRSPDGAQVVGCAFTAISAELDAHLEALVLGQLVASLPSIEFFETENGGDRRQLLLAENPLILADKRLLPL